MITVELQSAIARELATLVADNHDPELARAELLEGIVHLILCNARGEDLRGPLPGHDTDESRALYSVVESATNHAYLARLRNHDGQKPRLRLVEPIE